MSKALFNQEILKIQELLKSENTKIHFVGVGGVGMYSLFSLLSKKGYQCSGSDRAEGEFYKRLSERGFNVCPSHKAENAVNKDMLVYSLAVKEENPELCLAKELDIPAFTRARLLGSVILEYKRSVGVSGTHGKSTVTAMIHKIMCDSGIFPDCISGALLSSGDEPFDFNGSDTLVYEACEYKDSFLNFYPSYSVMLNLELDHTDYFKSIEQLKDSFLRAINNSEVAIINTDCKNLSELKNKTTARTVLAGRAHDSHYQLTDVSENDGKYSFSVREAAGRVTKIRLNVIGEFQVHNALMAFAFAREYGIPSEKIKASLEDYIGIPRRLELIGKYKNHKLYYDYAHHPSEIRAGITAITKAESAPIVIFRPHTYSRTSSLFYDFASSLSLAKQILILDIDGVREENESGVSSEALAGEIGNNAARVTENEIPALLDLSDSPIVIMGAANLDKVKNRLGKEK